ncbi:hypothetical protein EX30DRAFT_343450 [Ascodesmis nigricans]|uniref:RanBP2-type domain-containing protein n=1 Tax=Ascodesmis nigricans TaxID=341454 RepID=A0A4S2MMJ2_9PEZI|nr:hypothetical protein EX30DRAFT_343450 [Ascodesmis nigricans]
MSEPVCYRTTVDNQSIPDRVPSFEWPFPRATRHLDRDHLEIPNENGLSISFFGPTREYMALYMWRCWACDFLSRFASSACGQCGKRRGVEDGIVVRVRAGLVNAQVWSFEV